LIDWIYIADECDRKNVDQAFVFAILEHEPDQNPAKLISAIAHRLESYRNNPVKRDAFGRVRYTEQWIAYLQTVIAPTGLDHPKAEANATWFSSVLANYEKQIGGSFDGKA
jgi:hypothetical protein